MTKLSLEALKSKIADPEVALARIHATLQPGGGQGSRVYPPTFPAEREQSPYLLEDRARNGEVRHAVVLDQVPSEANRCDEALKEAWRSGKMRLPMLRLTVQVGDTEVVITGLDAPHRVFDAYWRDSLLDGVKFDKTQLGKDIQAASLEDAAAILKHDPATLTLGGWNSHRKGRQAKFPRVYTSEIVGWDPVLGTRKAGRMDPLNLTGARSGDGDEWKYSATAAKTAKSKLSEIGHGNIAPNATHGGVTISEATRFSTLSLTALRRIRFGTLGDSVQFASLTLLAALALAGDRLAFGGAGIWLRSGCDLVVESETLEWVSRGGEVEPFTLSAPEALALYEEALDEALETGVALALEPIDLAPSKELAAAIVFSLTKAESSGD